jgi:hypothetical protein
MPLTSSIFWSNPTQFTKIGQAVYIVALHSTGVTKTNTSPYPCQGTSLMRSTNTSIQCQNGPNMPLTSGRNQPMTNASNIHESQMRIHLPPNRNTLLYHAHDADPTLIVDRSTLVSRLSTATSTTMSRVDHLLDYCSTHPEAKLRYYA